jgi:hypothetical protein
MQVIPEDNTVLLYTRYYPNDDSNNATVDRIHFLSYSNETGAIKFSHTSLMPAGIQLEGTAPIPGEISRVFCIIDVESRGQQWQ